MFSSRGARSLRGLAVPVVALFILLTGCRDSAGRETPSPSPAVAPPPVTAQEVVIPTLYPSPTLAQVAPSATSPRRETPTSGPTVDFEQNVVELRYTIPALSLDRRLEGKVSGEVTVVDETTGLAVILQNQGGVLLELQQSLPDLELRPLADNCERCVSFSYSLPLESQSGEGWLTDPVFLASVENYTSLTIGPHFPPGTVAGLRRSASPYDPAHSLALTDEGVIYRWLATDPSIPEPLPAGVADANLRAALGQVSFSTLEQAYTVSCDGLPIERLFLNPAAGPVTDALQIRVVCPAFSLPASLLPLYLQMDTLLEEIVAEERLPRPPLALPLETMLDYQRGDGARLTLLLDGGLQAVSPAGATVTDTITSSRVVSLTTALAQSGALEPGVAAFAAGQANHILLVRDEEGMNEAAWDGAPPAELAAHLEEIDEILDAALAPAADIGPEPAVTGTITATATVTAGATITTTPATRRPAGTPVPVATTPSP